MAGTPFEQLEAQKKILRDTYQYHKQQAKIDLKNETFHTWYAEGIAYAYTQILGDRKEIDT